MNSITITYENLQGLKDLSARLRMDADIFDGVAPKTAAKGKKAQETFKPEDMDPPAEPTLDEAAEANGIVRKEASEPTSKKAAPTATIKIGEVIKGFQTYATKHGRPKAAAVLAKYGAKNVNEIQTTKYAEVLKVLNG